MIRIVRKLMLASLAMIVFSTGVASAQECPPPPKISRRIEINANFRGSKMDLLQRAGVSRDYGWRIDSVEVTMSPPYRGQVYLALEVDGTAVAKQNIATEKNLLVPSEPLMIGRLPHLVLNVFTADIFLMKTITLNMSYAP